MKHLTLSMFAAAVLSAPLVSEAEPFAGKAAAPTGWLDTAKSTLAEGPAAGAACDTIRAEGPAGLKTYLARLEQFRGGAEQAAVDRAIDRIAAQKDARFSGLYWYTNWDTAAAAARERGVPVLSLQLLGNLSDDLSCANSRLMRTVLYAHPDVASQMDENFVLHWHSVRPAPVLTVSFGGGRELKTTITGNSGHLVLDPRGHVVGAIPGMYSPEAFQRRLTELAEVARAVRELDGADFQREVAAYHAREAQRIARLHDSPEVRAPALAEGRMRPNAMGATRLTITKGMMELPSVESALGRVLNPGVGLNDLLTPAEVSRAYAEIPRVEAIHENSLRLIAHKTGAAAPDMVGFPASQLARDVSEDTIMNEVVLFPIVAEYLKGQETPVDAEAMRTYLYAAVFQTPQWDPWMGLVTGAYTGLDGNGRTEPAGAATEQVSSLFGAMPLVHADPFAAGAPQL